MFKRALLAALVALACSAPVCADQQLGAPRIDSSNNVYLPGGPRIGRFQNNKYNATPDILTLPSNDNGSSGDASGLSAVQKPQAPSDTIGRQFSDLFRSIRLTPAMFGAKADGRASYAVYTTTAGSPTVTMSYADFSAADVGKLIELPFAGANAQNFITTISAVSANGKTLTLASAPGTTLSAMNRRMFVCSDDSGPMQAMMTASAAKSAGWYIPAGFYCITTALNSRVGPYDNVTHAAPGWEADRRAYIKTMAPIDHMIRFGDKDSDFSQILRRADIVGGMWDANFLADTGVQIPFALEGQTSRLQVRNVKHIGIQLGDPAAPQPSAGHVLINVDIDRDDTSVPIASITKSTTPVVTTAHPHGFSTGRVVFFPSYIAGMTQLGLQSYEIDVTGPTTFTLRNVDTTSFGTFVSGDVAQTMHSNRLARRISNISQANPAVVTTVGTHNLTTGAYVHIADQRGASNANGIFQITVLSPTTYSLTGVDTTAAGQAYVSGGLAVEYLEVTDPRNQIGVYDANHTDAETIGGAWRGVRIGRAASPTLAGYDGKHAFTHLYNFGQDGELWAAFDLGGDNHMSGIQVDLPYRYGLRFRGPRNTVEGLKLQYNGFGILPALNDYASMLYLDTGKGLVTSVAGVVGQANMHNSGAKGTPALQLHSDISGNFAGFTGDSNYYFNVINPYGTTRQSYLPCQFGTVTVSGGVPTVVASSYNIASVTRSGVGDYTVYSNSANSDQQSIVSADTSGGGASYSAHEYTASRTPTSRRYIFNYNNMANPGTESRQDPTSFAISVPGLCAAQ
ncbi:hypothetical protein MMMDOFMJ_0204 [Methylobacterium gnaphalii]|uniref:Ubiquitin-activating enzyme E1 FCCH domain-containing protein n=2 Tax=Methylobacterium gnaphalii TaxID=1010610 RepID=A0A512JIL0_9HYPH|nr:hypothetical protein MGN01_16400 [Methylobacterium gnaphalii]GJD67290.1 hypothetical protein MMMDOFMJ_0204 [Methylobacterium gnaphalii]GLS49825.1 hypothetical protein GCM10007885_26770 [Methylobacterium gnaphalii]